MPRLAELRESRALADSRGRPITRGRVVFAFWTLAAMTLVCWVVAIGVTRETMAGSPTVAQVLWLVPTWAICAGGIYLLWRLARFARQLPKSEHAAE